MTWKQFKTNLAAMSDTELEEVRKGWMRALACKQMHEPGNELQVLGLIADEQRNRKTAAS